MIIFVFEYVSNDLIGWEVEELWMLLSIFRIKILNALTGWESTLRIRRLCQSLFSQKEPVSTIPGYHICICILYFHQYWLYVIFCINKTGFNICICILYFYQYLLYFLFVSTIPGYHICIFMLVDNDGHSKRNFWNVFIKWSNVISSVMQFKKGSFEVKLYFNIIVIKYKI